MAIEIISKQKIKEIPWLTVALFLVLAIFLAFLLSYLIFSFYQRKFTAELTEIEISLVRTPQEQALEKNILDLKKKIDDFAVLLPEHSFPTKVFAFLEQNTHPKVWFSNFKLIQPGAVLELTGNAESFQVLGQQMLIFQKNSSLKNVKLSRVSLDKEGLINFDLQLIFNLQQLQ